MDNMFKAEYREFYFNCKKCGVENKIIFNPPTSELSDEFLRYASADILTQYIKTLERQIKKVKEELNARR